MRSTIRVIGRLVAITCWVAPLVWLAWSRKWGVFAIALPMTAMVVVFAERARRAKALVRRGASG
jgi:hypothetical protein